MTNESATSGMAPAVNRATFQAELARLRAREKAHTREGDAIAAARRRLPMVEIDAGLTLTGPNGPVTLLDAFEGRRQLIAYYFMWDPGAPAAQHGDFAFPRKRLVKSRTSRFRGNAGQQRPPDASPAGSW